MTKFHKDIFENKQVIQFQTKLPLFKLPAISGLRPQLFLLYVLYKHYASWQFL
jgi:hypothetical protein